MSNTLTEFLSDLEDELIPEANIGLEEIDRNLGYDYRDREDNDGVVGRFK